MCYQIQAFIVLRNRISREKGAGVLKMNLVVAVVAGIWATNYNTIYHKGKIMLLECKPFC